MDNNSEASGESLAYDLRQRYAKIVGDHIEDVSYFRKGRKYSDYFRALEDLHTVIQHKFKSKTIKKTVIIRKKGAKDIKKEIIISYSTLKKEIIRISNEYQNAWEEKGRDQTEIAEIENSLRAVEMFLFSKMDDCNMFGSKRDMEGLI